MDWLRVVLDEGHTIRNPNALQTKAVLELKAERKWVLTGRSQGTSGFYFAQILVTFNLTFKIFNQNFIMLSRKMKTY